MEMSKRAATALEGSIIKWQKIVEQLEAGVSYGDVDEDGFKDCPLCKLYHPYNNGRDIDSGCSVCPIKMNTGRDLCDKTPYDYWGDGKCSAQEAAQDMLTYLISLSAS